MASEILVEGRTDFAKALSLSSAQMNEAAKAFVTEGADIIGDSAKEQWRSRPAGSRAVSQKTGKVYYKGYGPYKAQRPMPTIRTGNTRNSIRRRYVRKVGEGKWTSGTGPSTPYAPFVEFGSRHIASPAFPFMALGTKNAAERLDALANRIFSAAQE